MGSDNSDTCSSGSTIHCNELVDVLPSFEMDNKLFVQSCKNKKLCMPIHTTIKLPKDEYKPAEVISGSIKIQNRSHKPVSIKSMTVKLRGSGTIFNPMKNGRLLLPPILDMYDTSIDASIIPSSSTTTRTFTFMIPKYLLDTFCPHQIGEHLCLPPTYGSVGHRAPLSKQLTYRIEVEIESDEFIKTDVKPIQIDTTTTDYVYHMTSEATNDQLNKVSRYIEDELSVLSERKNLQSIDIRSPMIQNEIIFNSNSSKKSLQTISDDSFYVESVLSSSNTLVRSKELKIELEIFNDDKQGTLLVSFDAALLTLNSPFPINFKYKPPKKQSKLKMPKKVTFKPILIAVNYQSAAPIPVVFDKEFLNEGGFEETNLLNMRNTYSLKRQQLRDLASQVTYNESGSVERMARSLSTLTAQRLPIDVLDKHDIELKDWSYSKESGYYVCSHIISLSICKNLPIIRPFQLCQMGRLYLVEMDFKSLKTFKSPNKKIRCPVSFSSLNRPEFDKE